MQESVQSSMMKTNKKGGMVLQLLVSVIFGLLLFSVVWQIYFSYYRLSSAAQKDYDSLFKLANDIKVGELRSTPLALDIGTGIFVFEKGQDKIITNLNYNFLPRNSEYLKPYSCENKDNPCICLIQEFEVEKKNINGNDIFVHSPLKSLPCKTLGRNLKILPKFQASKYKNEFKVLGGTFMIRPAYFETKILKIASSDDPSQLEGITSEIERKIRLRQVYVTAKADQVLICGDYDECAK